MTNAEFLKTSAFRLELAVSENNLELAHQIIDERLRLLQIISRENDHTPDLVEAAKETLAHDEKLSFLISQEKESLRRKLHDVVIADKATQLYRVHSK
ncbi:MULTISPECIES: hypothetical protein [Aeromonas]|uniref:hypothetical protein n=1 Tax=Aeromonas TaxID=642 RepID=UPI000F97337C|nr:MULTISPECIES: hypothetical protein [Aeromonas]MBV7468693.1 hypothetical protein [Aeromonas sp. sif0611]MDM5075597.1 hypothetical protein [Aeromonas media]